LAKEDEWSPTDEELEIVWQISVRAEVLEDQFSSAFCTAMKLFMIARAGHPDKSHRSKGHRLSDQERPIITAGPIMNHPT
jgi:hypothetical protein